MTKFDRANWLKMNKIKKTVKSKQPSKHVVVDHDLDKFSGTVLFKKKVEKARKILLKSPIPSRIYSA
jgi:hypothetical protein